MDMNREKRLHMRKAIMTCRGKIKKERLLSGHIYKENSEDEGYSEMTCLLENRQRKHKDYTALS